ncbi:hypothetical protein ACTWJ8_38140 [Streptomyces sp. SDT5-1]|uniref:hypothetical protein n=1 Tax=Streptomyces sp. SDT5-1 TaxID=3406418 RepID=UPI003FD4843F
MIGLSEEPVLEPLVAGAWPLPVAFREGIIPVPGVPAVMWTLEGAIRRFVLLFLAEGQPNAINLPDTDRPE